jgi:hypothetical protein
MRAAAAEALNEELQAELELLREEIEKLRAREGTSDKDACEDASAMKALEKYGYQDAAMEKFLRDAMMGDGFDSFLREAFRELEGNKRSGTFSTKLPRRTPPRGMYMPIEQKVIINERNFGRAKEAVLTMRYEQPGAERQDYVLPLSTGFGGKPTVDIRLLHEAAAMLFKKVAGVTPPPEIEAALLDNYIKQLMTKGIEIA